MRHLALTLLAGALLALPAHAGQLYYWTQLNGLNESPANLSPGLGLARVTVDDLLNTMTVHVDFTGLTTPNTAAHIHCCTVDPFIGTAVVATVTPTFTGFPSGTTQGTYDHTFDLLDLSTYRAGFVTASGGTASGAEAVLLAGMAAGTTYLNIHTTNSPGGEIRGFLVPTPEPGTWLMAGIALGGLAARRRFRR